MAAQIKLDPYCTSTLNTTQSTALLANTLTLFVGLMLIIDYSMEADSKRAGDNYDTIGRSVISGIVVIVNLGVLVVPAILMVLHSEMLDKITNFSGGEDSKIDDESKITDHELPGNADTLSQPETVCDIVQLTTPDPTFDYQSHSAVSGALFPSDNAAMIRAGRSWG